MVYQPGQDPALLGDFSRKFWFLFLCAQRCLYVFVFIPGKSLLPRANFPTCHGTITAKHLALPALVGGHLRMC